MFRSLHSSTFFVSYLYLAIFIASGIRSVCRTFVNKCPVAYFFSSHLIFYVTGCWRSKHSRKITKCQHLFSKSVTFWHSGVFENYSVIWGFFCFQLVTNLSFHENTGTCSSMCYFSLLYFCDFRKKNRELRIQPTTFTHAIGLDRYRKQITIQKPNWEHFFYHSLYSESSSLCNKPLWKCQMATLVSGTTVRNNC